MKISELPKGNKIILFDGNCNLCNSFVQFVIRRDKKNIFRFVALQSKLGEDIRTHIGVQPKKTDSIILYEPNVAYYYKSDAAIEIARTLGGLPSISIVFKIVPTFLRNLIYDYVARNRYKWYGRKESCMVPTPELKAKFLE
jgi:predicted DCC family thiol-disulfide oxidoreductase YuxK